MINGFVNAIELVRAKSGDNCLRISTENCNTRFKNEFRYAYQLFCNHTNLSNFSVKKLIKI